MDIFQFAFSGNTVIFAGLFIICFLGYALGRIEIKGVSLGSAGVFLVAILFGFLCTLPELQGIPILKEFFTPDSSASAFKNYKFIETIGLLLFVTAVGFIAGPNFFRDFKRNAKSYIPLGAIIITVGATLAVIFALIPGIGSAFSTGILSGALTSTPAYSAAKDVAGAADGLVSLGQAIAYPFGVIGVVLFVQLVPKFLKADMNKERELMKVAQDNKPAEAVKEKKEKKTIELDSYGIGAFGVAILFGLLLGSIKIAGVSLGNTGGPLIVALILGHFGRIGFISFKIKTTTLKTLRELGLMLFLAGAGFEGGVQLVSQISNSAYGPMLILYGFIAGVIMTTVPLIVGYIFAKKVIKLSLLNNLGSLTGGMTSTPALGTLIGVAGTDDVAAAYASTYPIALVLVVLAANLIGTFIA